MEVGGTHMHPSLRLRGGEGGLLKKTAKLLSAPLWFFDAVDKEAFVLSIPEGVRRVLLKIMFLPTLLWTIFLHRAMPDQRRWYDRLDNRVIIGALPLKRQIDALSRVERVTGVLNFCDEFAGHREYEGAGIRQLRLPVLDYCSPTAQQLENGLEFIREQPAGGCTYVHCKAGRGRAGTMAMAYLMTDRGLAPADAQAELSRVRPHVSPRLWKRPSVREMHRRNQQRMLLQRQRQAAGAERVPPGASEPVPSQSPPPVP